ncbi:MAG: hypothetical protein M1324_03300 [Patescibacteria group bacterium]|nr:hypothetical protein [Patescibacteria group bacterium]
MYWIVPLNFTPTALNNQGVVVGYRRVANPEKFAFEAIKWKKGQFTRLGTFGSRNAIAADVNDQETILIGTDPGQGQMGGWHYIVVRIDGHQDTIEGMLDEDFVYLYRLNNLNQLVGSLCSRAGTSKGFIWSKQAQVTIKTEGSCSLQYINDIGQAVGYGPSPNTTSASRIPVIWTNSSIWPLETPFGGGNAQDINNDGWSVGSYIDLTQTTSSTVLPALWNEKGQLFKLQNLGFAGAGLRINIHGVILGMLDERPVIWLSSTAKPYFFADIVKNIKITNIIDFNDSGQILVKGERYNNDGYFLLVPR